MTTTTDREHNAAVLKRMLADIAEGLTHLSDLVNSLARRTNTLTDQITDATEFAVRTEQAALSRNALDEASSLATTMDQNLGGMSAAVVEAEQITAAAVTALAPLDEVEDDIRQAGAGLRSVAPARDGA